MPTVCASEYGGPGDPTSGVHGYHGDLLTGRMAFAELGMGTALGNLPYRSKLQITYNGRSVVAEKLDIGLGGPGCGGHPRAIDLWWETARTLGFNGLAPVDVSGGGNMATTQPVLFNIPGTPHVPGEEFIPGGGGSGTNPTEVFGAFKGLGEFGLDLAKAFPKIVKFFHTFFSVEGWIRIGKVLIGLFLLLSGILGMAKVEAGSKAVAAGKKGYEVGGTVAALVPK